VASNLGGASISGVASGRTATPPDPPPPGDLTITETTENSISLKWRDRSTNETGFRVERRRPGDVWSTVKLLGAHEGTGWMPVWQDVGLSPDTEYCYRVQAYHEWGAGVSLGTCARTKPQPIEIPEIVCLGGAMEPTYYPDEGQPFVVYFYFASAGTVETGTFKVRIALDGGVEHVDVSVPSLNPGETYTVWWESYGLPAGSHRFDAYADIDNQVQEFNESNNSAYVAFTVG
jgi:hypothetical protein